MPEIHSSSIVSNHAVLHDSVQIGPFCIVEAGATLGEGCILDSCVRICGVVRLGKFNHLCHGVSLGTEPQDLTFAKDKARPLQIGDYNHFKENVNISCGIKTQNGTQIGNYNYFMAFSHVGHDCVVGDHNILANSATLAGHVELAHHIFLSGQVAIHQFCRIGAYVIVGGLSGVAQDVPPFVMTNGQRAQIVGLNTVGLRRNGFNPKQRNLIQRAYKALYLLGLSRNQALQQIYNLGNDPEILAIIEFVNTSKRGLVSHALRRHTHR